LACELRGENRTLKRRLRAVECERDDVERKRLRETRSLKRRLRAVERERDGLAKKVETLTTEKAGLRAKLDEALRANKRQAAPFSRDKRTPDDKRKPSGRRSGAEHGRHGHRQPPKNPDVDLAVELPSECPHCGNDEIVFEKEVVQFQDEIVTAVVRRRFVIACGRCSGCGQAVRGRHHEQTSDALGAAGTMLGPKALALAAWLHYACGTSAVKISRLYAELGLEVTPGGITLALGRLADDATDTFEALRQALRMSKVVTPDETGWRVDAERGWLWVFVGDTVTVYDIATGEGARGFEVAAEMLGEDFDGVLVRDGWAPYRNFTGATHQTCYAHLMRRSRQMIADSVAGQARIPHAVLRLLTEALTLRARRDEGEIAGDELEEAIKALEARADALIAARVTHEPNRVLLAHLANERDALFSFLRLEGVPATNFRAEQAIRPQVCIRKNWGGNRTENGARATAVLGSVLRTATQQGRSPIDVLVTIATSDGERCDLDLSPP
jgi:transposase